MAWPRKHHQETLDVRKHVHKSVHAFPTSFFFERVLFAQTKLRNWLI